MVRGSQERHSGQGKSGETFIVVRVSQERLIVVRVGQESHS